jgi:hypothetical protein
VDVWLLVLSFATPIRSSTDHASKVVKVFKEKILRYEQKKGSRRQEPNARWIIVRL